MLTDREIRILAALDTAIAAGVALIVGLLVILWRMR